jgi:hypothetical protein
MFHLGADWWIDWGLMVDNFEDNGNRISGLIEF